MNNKRIERTLMSFYDGTEFMGDLQMRYYPFGYLLNNLLSDLYPNSRLKFINIYYNTKETFQLNNSISKDQVYLYKGYLTYHAEFDLAAFNSFDQEAQDLLIWNTACKYLENAGDKLDDSRLKNTVVAAHRIGIERKLNTDQILFKKDIIVHEKSMEASVWIIFNTSIDKMSTWFKLKFRNKIIINRKIGQTSIGIEFFFEIFRDIEVVNDFIVIKGSKEVDYLPFSIKIDSAIK